MQSTQLISLHHKTALITGGSGGIGSAIIQLLLTAGAKVISIDKQKKDLPGEVVFIPCDLTQKNEIDQLKVKILQQTEVLDIFIHCAGITRDAVLWKMSENDWHDVLQVNLSSAFRLLQISIPLLRQAHGGAIVLVSSINGERGKFGQANYVASKAGLSALAKTAALELGAFGIRANSVSPGWIETEMTENLPYEIRQKALQNSVLQRLGTPLDVAKVVLFLCSDWAGFVTGQNLRVDGGQLMV